MSLFIASLLLFAAVQAPASSPADGAQAGAQERVICRTTATTGSRLRKSRVCLTAREWENQAQMLQQERSRRALSLGSTAGD